MHIANSKIKLFTALELLKENHWQEAHKIVQELKIRQAYWLHGILHQIEGDRANAIYWYQRANIDYFPKDLDAEITKIEVSLKNE
jgi:hypothetical protein